MALGNTQGTAPATFTLTTPTGATETHTVPAGQTKDLTYPVIEDATSTVRVTATDLASFALSYTADCVQPAVARPTATGTVDCAGYTITLGNTGGTAPATFTVTAPTGATETHTVAPGDTKELTYPVVEDTATRVEVVADGLQDFHLTYVADCVPPVPVAEPTAAGLSTATASSSSSAMSTAPARPRSWSPRPPAPARPTRSRPVRPRT